MKIIFLFVAGFLFSATYGQDLIFNINQHGVSYKNAETKKFDDAEVKNSEMVITLQDKVVKVIDEDMKTISLEKMSGQNNNIKHIYTQVWKATDASKQPVQFRFTVNVETKEAMVEVGYKNYKNYYFGKYTYGNMKDAAVQMGSSTVSN